MLAPEGPWCRDPDLPRVDRCRLRRTVARSGLAARTLLPRSTALGIGREHVYYRRPRNHAGIAPGARILWYVKGTTPTHPRGSVRAVSTVAEVVHGRPDALFHRFARLGVYSQAQVQATAEPAGSVMAIRFVDTECLAEPIGYDQLVHAFAEVGRRFQAPQSPRLIPEHLFCLLYARSSAYVH